MSFIRDTKYVPVRMIPHVRPARSTFDLPTASSLFREIPDRFFSAPDLFFRSVLSCELVKTEVRQLLQILWLGVTMFNYPAHLPPWLLSSPHSRPHSR